MYILTNGNRYVAGDSMFIPDYFLTENKHEAYTFNEYDVNTFTGIYLKDGTYMTLSAGYYFKKVTKNFWN